MWSLARYSIPAHALLPPVVGWLAALGDVWLMWFLALIHLGFPVILVLTYRYWRGQGVQLAFLIIANHAATLAAGIALIAWTA